VLVELLAMVVLEGLTTDLGVTVVAGEVVVLLVRMGALAAMVPLRQAMAVMALGALLMIRNIRVARAELVS
jgi:hypothetical protein